MDFRETDRVETSDVATAELTRTEAETPVESTAGVKATLNGDVEPTVHARRFAVETDASRDALPRSEERRVGKACVSTWSSRWSPYHQQKKTDTQPQRTRRWPRR